MTTNWLAVVHAGMFAAFVSSPFCGTHNLQVEFHFAEGYHFSAAERRTIEKIADAAEVDARRLLPPLSHGLTVRVVPGKHVIPETGETSEAVGSDTVTWVVDPDQGVEGVAGRWLRASLLHEFHYLARKQSLYPTQQEGEWPLMDVVVEEGLATAFERDFGGVSPPWGAYPSDAGHWVDELMALPPTEPQDEWIARPTVKNQQRRWMGIRAGTYLADRAMRASGKTSAELVSMPTDEIIRLALR